jgi:hypothetical protein
MKIGKIINLYGEFPASWPLSMAWRGWEVFFVLFTLFSLFDDTF